MTLSELRARYKGSVLGFLWTFINPLLTLIVYSIVFSTVMRIRMVHYSAFLFIGILSWNMFATSVQSSAGVVIRQSSLVKKIYFPRHILPLSVVSGGVLNFLFSCCILIPFLIVNGYRPDWQWAWLIPLTFCEAIMAAGFALLVSAVNVYLRDLEHMLSIFLMLWFYVTPIVYSPEMIPHHLLQLFKLNPVTGCIMGFQCILYFHSPLHWKIELYSSLFAIVIFLIGWVVFGHLSKRFAEEV
ncbi:MAG: ABC transporter permease [Alicyclobacillus sp.]|nr:ABC transporter permease [Alicyclobacillus sp.]